MSGEDRRNDIWDPGPIDIVDEWDMAVNKRPTYDHKWVLGDEETLDEEPRALIPVARTHGGSLVSRTVGRFPRRWRRWCHRFYHLFSKKHTCVDIEGNGHASRGRWFIFEWDIHSNTQHVSCSCGKIFH